MGTRENKVETELKAQMKAAGGVSRKWKSPGIDGVPDQITIRHGAVRLVEVKTVNGELSTEQMREHQRLRDCGAVVTTVYGFKGVMHFMDDVWNNRVIKHEYR